MTNALKYLTVIALIILVVSGVLLIVEKTIDDTYEYSEELGGYILTKCNTVSIDVTIPSEYNGKPIVGIGSCAFQSSPGVYKVTLPDTIKYIGIGAFEETLLTKINLPEGLNKIDENAFKSTCIKEIVIPRTCKFIGDRAFSETKLKNVYIEGGETRLQICRKAFTETKFDEIYIPYRVEFIGDGCFDSHKGNFVINCEVFEGYYSNVDDWSQYGYNDITINYNVPREEN